MPTQAKNRAVITPWREHLQAGAGQALVVERGQRHGHQAHVRHRREADHVLQVVLGHGDKRAIDHVDQREQHNPRRVELGAVGQQHDAHAQGGERAQLHQHAGVEHGHGRRRGHVAVGRPVVEGEDAAQHREAKEDEREDQLLEVDGSQGVPAKGLAISTLKSKRPACCAGDGAACRRWSRR